MYDQLLYQAHIANSYNLWFYAVSLSSGKLANVINAYPLTITGAPERSSVLTVTSTTKPFPVGRPCGVTTCFSSRIPKFVSGWNLSPFQQPISWSRCPHVRPFFDILFSGNAGLNAGCSGAPTALSPQFVCTVQHSHSAMSTPLPPYTRQQRWKWSPRPGVLQVPSPCKPHLTVQVNLEVFLNSC